MYFIFKSKGISKLINLYKYCGVISYQFTTKNYNILYLNFLGYSDNYTLSSHNLLE